MEEARSLLDRVPSRRVRSAPDPAKVQQALDTATRSRELPTVPALAGLLPGGALRGGSAYTVSGSTALAMALMAGPSGEGAWCGVVGLPWFGAEAAGGLGVDLGRLVLVPEPGREWLSVVAALVDALTVVVVRPPGAVTSGEAARLSARLRTRGAVLVALTDPAGATGRARWHWPGSEARLTVDQHDWSGLGDGFGRLVARQATVTVLGRGTAGRPRRHQLWLPGADGTVHPVETELVPDWRHEAAG